MKTDYKQKKQAEKITSLLKKKFEREPFQAKLLQQVLFQISGIQIRSCLEMDLKTTVFFWAQHLFEELRPIKMECFCSVGLRKYERYFQLVENLLKVGYELDGSLAPVPKGNGKSPSIYVLIPVLKTLQQQQFESRRALCSQNLENREEILEEIRQVVRSEVRKGTDRAVQNMKEILLSHSGNCCCHGDGVPTGFASAVREKAALCTFTFSGENDELDGRERDAALLRESILQTK